MLKRLLSILSTTISPYTTLFRSARLVTPNAERVWLLRYAFKDGMTVDDVHACTKIDPWFLHHVRELVERSEEYTSELQSQSKFVCCILIEKKKVIILPITK